MGVIGSLPLARSTIRAALFCTICNLDISFSGMPKRRALQESILEETNAICYLRVCFFSLVTYLSYLDVETSMKGFT